VVGMRILIFLDHDRLVIWLKPFVDWVESVHYPSMLLEYCSLCMLEFML